MSFNKPRRVKTFKDVRGLKKTWRKGRDYLCWICAHKKMVHLNRNSLTFSCSKPRKSFQVVGKHDCCEVTCGQYKCDGFNDGLF